MSCLNYNLRPVWDGILDVYKEFLKVCQNHHLRFYAAYGTALGTIRHKGFIPWDDDFDVFMPQADYDHFMLEAWRDLPEWLKPINWDNSSSFTFRFGKVQDIREDVAKQISKQSGHPLNEGLYIDLFPLGGYHQNRLRALILRSRKAFLSRSKHQTLKSKFGYMLGCACGVLPTGLNSLQTCRQWDEKFARELSFDEADRVGYYNAPWCRFNFNCPRSYFDEIEWYDFENVQVPMPRNYDAYLRAEFGDYMKYPPVDQQQLTHLHCPPAPWRYGPDKQM